MKTSAWQQIFIRIRSNKIFELTVVFIIIFSALVVGVKTYSVSPMLESIIRAMDWFITFFFVTEITIRFIAEEQKKNFFKNAWNVFDTLIVTVSLIPIEDSELAIIGRLIRIFRVLRMISMIPELRMLLNSLIKALPQLGYILLMMFIIFYIYAAIGSTFFEAINPTLWGDISISLLTLFRVMTFEDWTDVMYESMEVYPLSWIYYLSFIFFTAFAFLNMIIGIVVNVLNDEHELIRQEEQEKRLTIEDLDKKIDNLTAMIEKQMNKQ
ncbi:MAG: ion transporter [Pseudomonadota bacterium]